jgi:hypothetical protein
VDAEGPLARLKNLLFNRETLLTIAQWITVLLALRLDIFVTYRHHFVFYYTGILVGCLADGCGLCPLYGRLHQVLRGTHPVV